MTYLGVALLCLAIVPGSFSSDNIVKNITKAEVQPDHDTGDSNNVQKEFSKLFERPLQVDSNPPMTKKEVFELTKKIVSSVQTEPGAQPEPPVEEAVVNEILNFGRDKSFSSMINKHGRIAANLVHIFLIAPTTQDLLSLAKAYRPYANPGMFNYALSVVLMNRKDTENLRIPAHSELFPDMYVPKESIDAVRNGNGSKL